MKKASSVILKSILIVVACLVQPVLFAAEVPIKSQLRSSIKKYEENIYKSYRSIEFLEHKKEKIIKNNKLDMEYSQTRRFTYDFEKKMLYVKVIDFKLIDGKNSKHIKIGDEKKERLKDFYGLSSYFEGPWKNIQTNTTKNIVSFNTSQWFYNFNCDIQLQEGVDFPQTIEAVTANDELEITLYYDCCDDIYMLTRLSTKGSYQILFDKFNLESNTMRDNFKIEKR